ncbi:MAG TPA: hypothetical protein VNO31_42435, partial [Umezawaea sp.]|nr:hypothetical protein [Umezawaea sp.]
NRMGRGVRIADRALDALRASDKAKEQETSWRLRIELAACATAVGAPLTGFGAVRPVLAAEGVPHALRAAALVQASDCLVTIGRGPQLGMALSEADQLYVADTLIDADTRLLQRGLLHASAAAQHRRWGDLQAATDAAGKGLELLAKLGDPTVDSGQVRAKLTLELVCALMDSNRLAEASEVGSPLLDLPVRAPSAGDVGWLRLALATRVHLPAGRVDLARGMLRDAADSAQRHQLDTLLAESLLALAHVHEVSGDLAEALTDLRSAHAAERRRARAVYAVRARLAAEFSGAHRQPVSPHEQLGSLLRPGDGRSASAQGAMRGSQPPADAVLAPELKQQLRQWRPTQAPKQEGQRVKRSLRAAEDMTVEGISAARAHAADRWRLVQPFGANGPETTQDSAVEPAASSGGRRRAEDREPVESPATPEQGEAAVPATGLIAAAGAMRSGRRRAAREAAEDDTAPTQAPPVEPSAPTAPWAAQQVAPEPAPEAVPDSASDTSPEVANVLDTLEAAGLLNKRRSGGRRRAADPEGETGAAQQPADPAAATSAPQPEPPSQTPQQPAPEAPKWRVEPPPRLRSEDDQPKPPPSDLFDAPTTVQLAVGADGLPVERPSTGISAAFAKGPVIPPARAPQTASAPEPPHPAEPPHRPTSDASPAANHPTGTPHVGPDFHLGADSLGRSGFRPASNRPPTAPGAFPADSAQGATPAQAPRPQGSTPGQVPAHPDFRLSADSFGRDGFRTSGNPVDPDPTTPHDWPTPAVQGEPNTSPQATNDIPSWAADGSTPQSPDWSAAASNRTDGSGGEQQGWAAGTTPDGGHQPNPSAEPGARVPGTGQQQGHGRDAEPNRDSAAAAQHQEPGHGTGSHSTDWAVGDSAADGGHSNPAHGSESQGWATGGVPGSHSADWTSGVPRPATSGGFGGSRSAESDGGFAHDASHQQDLGQGFGAPPGWAGTPGQGPASTSGGPSYDAPGAENRPRFDGPGDGSTPDPLGRTDQNFGADSRQAVGDGVGTGSHQAAGDGVGADSYGRADQGFGADSRQAVGDGFETGSHQAVGDGVGADPYGRADQDFGATPRQTAGGAFGADSHQAMGDTLGAGSGEAAGGGFGSDSHRRADQGVDGLGDSFGDGFGQADHGVGRGSSRSSGVGQHETGPSPVAGSGSDQSTRSEFEADAPSWAPGVRPTWDPGFTPTGAGYPGTQVPGAESDFSFDTDFSATPDSLSVPQPPADPTPDHEPEQVPAVPEPDQIPPIPDPDPIPQPAPIPMPPTSSGFDLGRSRFLTSADVEDDLPELPRR